MTHVVNTAGAGAAVAAAQQMQAQRTMGPLVKVEPDVWLDVAASSEHRVAVHAQTGMKWFGIKERYLISAHGLYFWTDSPTPLRLPADLVLIEAKSIHIP